MVALKTEEDFEVVAGELLLVTKHVPENWGKPASVYVTGNGRTRWKR